MAAYTSVGAVRQVLAPDGDETRETSTAASLSDDELNLQIVAASAQVDVALGQRYPVPFSPVPPIIAGLTADIAAYLALLTWRKGGNVTSEHPLVLRYARAVALLEALGTGKATISAPADSSAAVVVNILTWDEVYSPWYGPGQGVIQGG
jgi:phage gp36-like protein